MLPPGLKPPPYSSIPSDPYGSGTIATSVKSRNSSTPEDSWSECRERRPGQLTGPGAAAIDA